MKVKLQPHCSNKATNKINIIIVLVVIAKTNNIINR